MMLVLDNEDNNNEDNDNEMTTKITKTRTKKTDNVQTMMLVLDGQMSRRNC